MTAGWCLHVPARSAVTRRTSNIATCFVACSRCRFNTFSTSERIYVRPVSSYVFTSSVVGTLACFDWRLFERQNSLDYGSSQAHRSVFGYSRKI
jgi:hypothetical protein